MKNYSHIKLIHPKKDFLLAEKTLHANKIQHCHHTRPIRIFLPPKKLNKKQ